MTADLSLCPKLELSIKYCAVADAAKKNKGNRRCMVPEELQDGQRETSDLLLSSSRECDLCDPSPAPGIRNVFTIYVRPNSFFQSGYGGDFFERRTLFTMLAAVKPTTMAIMLIRISRAIETAEGEMSTE